MRREGLGHPMTEANHDRSEGWLAVVSTVLLALATVATAWAGYQASRWHGEQAQSQTRATAARLESTRASGVANRQVQIDVAVFIQWVDAHAHGDPELKDFYEQRFPDRFKPPFDAWIATDPFENPEAPPTPFAMPEYRLAAINRAERLEAAAVAASEDARQDIERADKYVLCVVLFAASLFFAGISTRLRTRAAETAILGLGCLLFLGTLVWLSTFPVSVAL
jgi:hypothetical protein